MTRFLFSAESATMHPTWQGFVVNRDLDIAWLRLHDDWHEVGEVTISAVPGTKVLAVTGGGRLAGFAFPDASLYLPAAIVVPGAARALSMGHDPVSDVAGVLLTVDEPHPSSRQLPFRFRAGGRDCLGMAVVEPNGMLARVLVAPASVALPEGMLPHRTRTSRLGLRLRRAARRVFGPLRRDRRW